jgi:hypothetical protein
MDVIVDGMPTGWWLPTFEFVCKSTVTLIDD